MRKLILSAIFLTTLAALGHNASRFDGTWNTTVTCEPKGGALGYTLHSVRPSQAASSMGSAAQKAKNH